MHRSGTSPVARLLNFLGVYLGAEERLMPPAEGNNPRGFWEHLGFVEINEEILKHFGGSWEAPPQFPPDWETLPEISYLRKRARELIRQEFQGARIWGWKDPRNCLTLPFWQQVIPRMRYIICLRNPLEVVGSLRERDRLSSAQSVRIWLDYTVEGFRHTAGKPRLITCYEDYFLRWDVELKRLAGFVGLKVPPRGSLPYGEMQKFLQRDLRHHHSSLLDAMDAGDLGFPAKALYFALRVSLSDAAVRQQKSSVTRDQAINAFVHGLKTFQSEVNRLAAGVATLEEVRGRLEEALAERQVQVQGLEAALQAKDVHIATLEGVRGQLEGALEERQGQVQGLEAALQAKDGEIANLEGMRGQLEQALAERQGHVQGLEAALRAKDGEIANLEGIRGQLEQALAERQGHVQGLEAALQAKDGEIANLEGIRGQLEETLAERQGQVQGLEGALQAKDGHIANLTDALVTITTTRGWKLLERYRRFRDRTWSALFFPGRLFLRRTRRLYVWFVRAREFCVRKGFIATHLSTISTYDRATSLPDVDQAIRWLGEVEIGGLRKAVLFAHPEAHVKFRLRLDGPCTFRSLVALMPEVWGKNVGGADFTVIVRREGGRPPLSKTRRVNPSRKRRDRSWRVIRMSLGHMKDEPVEVTLSTSIPPGCRPDFAWAAWGDPAVLVKKANLPALVLRKALAKRRGGGVAALWQWGIDSWKEMADDLSAYQRWLALRCLTPADLSRIQTEVSGFAYRPVVSVITPVYNTNARHLTACIESVRGQVYPYWRLCLCDDGSTCSETLEVLKRYEGSDPRIKIRYLPSNQGISGASNEALALADGEFVALLDHDDELQADAFYEVARLLNDDPHADFVYSDEDKIDQNGIRCCPFFKPDWSPDLLLSMNYITHLSVMRRRLALEVGGFRRGFEGSQDFDLFLRLVERTDRIRHVPKPLYSWRMSAASTAGSGQAKPFAHEAGRRAIEEAVRRRGINGMVDDGLVLPNRYRVRYFLADQPKVSIIIPTRDKKALLEQCVRSLETRTTYRKFEIIIVDNQSREEETLTYLAQSPHRVISFDEPFNFSRINNVGSRHATGDVLLFLNNDTEVIAGDWLEAMVEHVQRPEVGVVGAKLLYPNGTIQHGGVVIGFGGFAGHAFWYLDQDDPGYFDFAKVIRNYSAVTGACLALRRGVFEEVGGFDEHLGVAFGDIDLCLRIRERGFLVVWTPYALLYHYESASRGALHPESDEQYARARWKALLDSGDPYYNPNLSLSQFDFSLRL